MHSFTNVAAAILLADAVVSIPLGPGQHEIKYCVDVGPRPFYINNNMTDGALKENLTACKNNKLEIADFTIGHYGGGGTPKFSEETVQSTMVDARVGYIFPVPSPNRLHANSTISGPEFWNVM
jgi:glycerophosphoryl diester phosphodiesterase